MKYLISDGFPYYIELVESIEITKLIHQSEQLDFLDKISEERSMYQYSAEKWSIKQIVGHITDHERIMCYRALRFSRKDKTSLPGYDQNVFVENSRFDELSYASLLKDLKNVRNATISFFNSLSQEQLRLKGYAWKFELSVEDTLRAIIGHEAHHIHITKEKYLKE